MATGGQYFGSLPTGPQCQMDDYARKRAWETGEADYLGADSFANIQKKYVMNINCIFIQ